MFKLAHKVNLIVVFFLMISFLAQGSSMNDGYVHLFHDDTYQYWDISLDYYGDRIPGTRIDLVDGGVVDRLDAYNHSSINIYGGEVTRGVLIRDDGTFTMSGGLFGLYGLTDERWGLDARNRANINISGGLIGGVSARDYSTILITGGDFDGIYATGHSDITINGGLADGWGIYAGSGASILLQGGNINTTLKTGGEGTIYLNGSNFEINGQSLSYGDRVSNFVPLTTYTVDDEQYNWYNGYITGNLLDGNILNTEFEISRYNMSWNSDIIIIPEPATLILLSMGSLLIIKPKNKEFENE